MPAPAVEPGPAAIMLAMSSERTIREFTRQVAYFEQPGSHFADGGVLDWIAGQVKVGPQDRVLDVAGGTGQLGRHLGRGARLTVIADLTPAMLARGVEAVRAEGRRDVVFVEADAAALPFSEAQFEVVVSRFALHHMPDVPAALREMRRVCTPGGTVTIIDMIADPGPIGERLDELERLRDPSHTASPHEAELRSLLDEAGLQPAGAKAAGTAVRPVRAAVRDERLLAEPWLQRAQPAPGAHRAVLDALHAEAAGGAATGLCGALIEGALTITHRYLVVHCKRT